MSDDVEFSLKIEKYAVEKRLSFLDALIQYCEENYIDVLDIVPYINKSLKDKLEVDGISEGKLTNNKTSKII